MVSHELLQDQGILIIKPTEKLQTSDFETIGEIVDPYIDEHGRLTGILIDAAEFPGWADLDAARAHLGFVRDHHEQVDRIAAVSDDAFLTVMPTLVGPFVDAEVKHFAADERDAALAWLADG